MEQIACIMSQTVYLLLHLLRRIIQNETQILIRISESEFLVQSDKVTKVKLSQCLMKGNLIQGLVSNKNFRSIKWGESARWSLGPLRTVRIPHGAV